MPSLEFLLPFFIATAVFACIPGPGLLYAAARTISHGQSAGWLAAIGLHLGGYAHILATACGLATLLNTVPIVYGAVKLAGAAYLVWLGFRMLASRHKIAHAMPGPAAAAPRRAMTESIIVELLNPKTALFYLSFLPQFIDLEADFPVWLQILLLGTIVNFMFSFTDAACVLLSVRAVRLLRASEAANRLAHRLGGGILMALGVNLALAKQ